MSRAAATRTGSAHVGRSVRRLDGAELLTGRAGHVADLRRPRTLSVAVVRSTCAHARLRRVDASAARALAGVHDVLIGAEAHAATEPTPHFIDPAGRGGQRVEARCLAHERVRWVGEPVAAVVADTPQQAHAAARLVAVDYEPLPAVLDADAALAPDAPLLYDGWGENVLVRSRLGAGDAVGTALASAPHVLTEELRVQRSTTAPIEPRAYLAEPGAGIGPRADLPPEPGAGSEPGIGAGTEPGTDGSEPSTPALTLHATTQNPEQLRTMVAHALRLDRERVRVVAPRLGGAFGLKMPGHPEEVLVCLLALRTGRPVRWVQERAECFLAGAREQRHRVEVGFDDDGRILALRDDVVTDVGAGSAQPGWSMSPLAALTLPTGYRVQAVDVRLQAVVTNKAPWIAARGYGKETANFVMERVLDLVAAHRGLDPALVRRRNFVAPDEMPYRTATGLNIDSGDYPHVLDRALELLGYDAWRAQQEQARADGRLLGVGLAFELTPEASNSPNMLGSGRDAATVRVDAQGGVTVLTGVTSPGGGNETGIAQVVADELDRDPEEILVVQGDTAVCPPGSGNYSGRSTVLGASAAALAARDVRAQLDRGAHAPVEATHEYLPGNTSQVPDERGRIQPYPTYSNAVFAVVAEVDRETGAVDLHDLAVCHDCGTVLNPHLVEGQMHGAVAMGVGLALSEQLVHDERGALVNDRFKAYLLPRASDLRDIRMAHVETPSPFTLLGTKGAGEAGVGGTQAAIANAVADALAPLGVAVRALPLTPPAVLSLIRDAAASTDRPSDRQREGAA